jgi:molecular chaperone GrpE (heat shock protein)
VIPFYSENKKVQQAAERVARHAMAVAGGPAPPEGRSAEQSLATIDNALSVLAEDQRNAAREVQRLAAAAGDSHQSAADALARSVLVLADLRDRLRAVASGSAGGADPGTLNWAIARLNEALAGVEVREFTDEGTVDVQRHQIVDRRQADRGHPAGAIARSVRPGLTLGGALLRPQQVVIFASDGGGTDG